MTKSSSLLLDNGCHLLNSSGDKILANRIEVLLVFHFQAFQRRLDSELHFLARLLQILHVHMLDGAIGGRIADRHLVCFVLVRPHLVNDHIDNYVAILIIFRHFDI